MTASEYFLDKANSKGVEVLYGGANNDIDTEDVVIRWG